LSIVEFCRRKEISQASFFQWRRKLQASELPSNFVPVSLVREATHHLSGGAAIEVAFLCGAILRLPASDEAALRGVVAALLAAEGPPR
jgi:hypothetical protein